MLNSLSFCTSYTPKNSNVLIMWPNNFSSEPMLYPTSRMRDASRIEEIFHALLFALLHAQPHLSFTKYNSNFAPTGCHRFNSLLGKHSTTWIHFHSGAENSSEMERLRPKSSQRFKMANWRQLELDFSNDLALSLHLIKIQCASSFQVGLWASTTAAS